MASVEEITRAGNIKYRGIPWDAQNRKKGPTRVFDFETDAWAYARGWERDRDQVADAFGARPDRNRRKVKFADYAMAYARRAEGEQRTADSRVKLARVLGNRITVHVDEIDRKLINDVLADWSHLAPGTRRNRISFLRKVLAEAVLDNLIHDNPCRDIEAPSRASVRDHVIPTEDQVAAVLDHMPDWFEPAILLAHDSGLREAEVCGLRWHRIDWQRKVVTVKDVLEPDSSIRAYPKGKERRIIPLSDRTIAAVRAAKLRQGAGEMDFVVRRPGAPLMTTNSLKSFWSYQVAKVTVFEAGRPTFHDLRHACAHRLVRAGIDLRTLQAFMGHKSLDTTRIYMPDVTTDELSAALKSVHIPAPAPVVAIAGT
jgi:integrase